MALEEARRNEIAYLFLKDFLKKRGFPIDKNFVRKAGNTAKATGVPKGEMLEFSRMMATELLAEVSDESKSQTREDRGHWHDHGEDDGFADDYGGH